MPGLEDLRQYYPWLVKEGVKKLDPRNHGNAWSIYFADPEGNRVELYCSSPWHVSQPFGEPLDLTEPADVIRAKTEAMVKQDPTCQPMDVWVAEMQRKMSSRSSASRPEHCGRMPKPARSCAAELFRGRPPRRARPRAQCAIRTGSSACARMWLVAPPKIICRNRLWV